MMIFKTLEPKPKQIDIFDYLKELQELISSTHSTISCHVLFEISLEDVFVLEVGGSITQSLTKEDIEIGVFWWELPIIGHCYGLLPPSVIVDSLIRKSNNQNTPAMPDLVFYQDNDVLYGAWDKE